MIVTVEEAATHLHIDLPEAESGEDTSLIETDLELKIKAASKAIIRYLGDYAENVIEYDSDDEIVDADEDVKIACLLLVGEFYKNREGAQDGEIQGGYGYLPRSVVALLYPLRDPVTA